MNESGTEMWLPAVDHPGYEVSSQGRVRSLDRVVTYRDGRQRTYKGQLRRANTDRSGYLYLPLERSVCVRVHVLVLEAFVRPRIESEYGCHNDGNRLNNSVSNLRWDSPSGNAVDQLLHGTNSRRNRLRCPRGHLLQAPNLMPTPLRDLGHRLCLACSRARPHFYAARHRGEDVDLQTISDERYRSIMRASVA